MARRKQYFKANGYPTDHILDELNDEQLLDRMGVPARYWGAVLHTPREFPDEVAAWAASMRYIFRPDADTQREDPVGGQAGMGLLLYGEPGEGKTTMAATLLLHLVRLRIPNIDPSGRNWTWSGPGMGGFFDWQETSELFRLGNSGDEVHAANAERVRAALRLSAPMTERADYAVIDDISRERATEYNLTELQRILRHRYDRCFVTILTSNYSPDQWPEVYGEVFTSFLGRAFLAVRIG